ncbi:MAG: cytochrome c3 family protein [Nitrospirae bacterium]|nr:cytochrome c3 family protein [Nitrospirota bacterium]
MDRETIQLLLISLLIILFSSIEANGGTIIKSRHDLSAFNFRGYKTETGPMQGGSFNDYGEACIYCHTPHNASSTAPLWNRNLPDPSGYQMYTSPNFDSKVAAPDGISLACLSCHDGSVAVDSVVNKPKYHTILDAQVHYKMSPEGGVGTDSCGKCHNRLEGAYGGIGAVGIGGAHDATVRYLTRDLRDDHPFSMAYPKMSVDPGFNQPALIKKDGGRMFTNGIQTFEGDKVQCASCHDPHNPDEKNLEGRDPFLRTSNKNSALCLTCHIK